MRLAACALALAALAAGCNNEELSTRTPGDRVSLYAVVPLRGPHAATGADVRDGMKLALNRAGGKAGQYPILFRPVSSTRRGRVTPRSAARGAREGAQDASTIAAISALTAAEGRWEIPVLNQAGVPIVTPTATARSLDDPDLSPLGHSTLTRLPGDDRAQADEMVRLLGEERCPRVRVVVGPTPQDRDLATLVREALGPERDVGTGAAPCLALANGEPAAAARAARARGVRAVVASSALADPAFARALGRRAERRVRIVVPDPHAEGDVAAQFERTFGRPASTAALLGYDAAQAVVDAMRRAGDRGNDRVAVAAQLRETAPLPWATLRVRGGRLAPLTPR